MLTFFLLFVCNVNKRNNLGSTPLDTTVAMAASHLRNLPDGHRLISKFKEVISSLLEKGADIEIKDNNGESALMTAVIEPVLLDMFLKKGADKDTRNSQGCGLYHTVIERHLKYLISLPKTKEIIKLLKENGLDINMEDNCKRNALHVAVNSEESTTDLVQILVDHGCDVAARDSFGYMPIHYAMKNERIFRQLWDLTLPHLNESDFNNLRILAHWKGINNSQVITAFAEHLIKDPSLEAKPVSFNYPEDE